MSVKRKTIKALSQGLALCSIDELLKQRSFERGSKSLVYRRSCDRLGQTIDICFDLSPGYEPGAIAHVLPQVCIECQEVVPVIERMTSGIPTARAFSGSAASTIGFQQIQNLAPREQRLDWFLYGMDRANTDMHPLKAFIADWVIPFLDEYSSLESLLVGYERGDWRLPNDNRFHLYVAACYVLHGLPNKGLDLLNRRFGQAGPRKQYAQAFDYLTSLVNA